MIDARGLSCPIPVIKVKQAVESKPATVEVLVDNIVAVQNITRFANSVGYQISVKELEDEEFSLTLSK